MHADPWRGHNWQSSARQPYWDRRDGHCAYTQLGQYHYGRRRSRRWGYEQHHRRYNSSGPQCHRRSQERIGNRVGVVIDSFASNNTIGGTTAAARNIVSGNREAGIELNSGGRGTLLQGNFVGTNVSGTAKIPNAFGVVINGSANNTIGGTTAEARNIISGNVTTGVRIINAGATNNVVQGNFIGTDVTGTRALANGEGANGDGTAGYGIEVGQIGTGPSNTTIGGTAAGAGNLISGNSYIGVSLLGNLNGVNIQGNLIGTDITGRVAIHTHFVGISIGTTSAGGVTISGTSTSERNNSSGNENGMNVGGAGVAIEGNYIGTDVTGTVAVANTNGGIALKTFNTIGGGTTHGGGNVISGNDRFGIQFGDPSLFGTTFKGNLI